LQYEYADNLPSSAYPPLLYLMVLVAVLAMFFVHQRCNRLRGAHAHAVLADARDIRA
jgi:hypothetical protein